MTPKPLPTELQRRRTSGEATRAAILAAAERHFADRGFEAARLEDIAAEVGIRRPAIFYHFRDKQELYEEVLEEALGSWTPPVPETGNLAQRLEAAVSSWIDYVGRRPSVARLILREAANAGTGPGSPLLRAGGPLVEWYRALVQQGVAAGELRPLTDPHRFLSLVGASTVFHFAAMPHLTPDVPFDPWSDEELERHKREMLRVARHMLGIGAGSEAEAR